jgi:hypothetical protein
LCIERQSQGTGQQEQEGQAIAYAGKVRS